MLGCSVHSIAIVITSIRIYKNSVSSQPSNPALLEVIAGFQKLVNHEMLHRKQLGASFHIPKEVVHVFRAGIQFEGA